MNAIPVLTIDDVATLDGVLADFLKKAEAELTVVIDRGGNVISQYGDMTVMDVTIIAALAAGSFAATRELARRIGEIEFNALYHQGNGSHIFMNSVDEETIMITVFGPRTTVSSVFTRPAPPNRLLFCSKHSKKLITVLLSKPRTFQPRRFLPIPSLRRPRRADFAEFFSPSRCSMFAISTECRSRLWIIGAMPSKTKPPRLVIAGQR